MVRERASGGATAADIVAAVLFTLALDAAVFVPVLRETALRIPLGFLFTLFVPGYVLVAAVYPDGATAGKARADGAIAGRSHDGSGITLLERLLLSVACSVVLVPAVGYAFNFTRFGVRLAPILLATSGLTLLLAAVAAVRRRRTPEGVRFEPPALPGLAGVVAALRPNDATALAVDLALVGALAFFLVGVGSVGVDVASSEPYSEVYLMNAEEDQLLAVNDSGSPAAGSNLTVRLAIENHRTARTNYTVVVVQQTVGIDDGNVTSVERQDRLDRFSVTVGVDVTEVRPASVRSVETPGPSRVVWLVYVGDPPSAPSTRNADYRVSLWVADSGDGTNRSNVVDDGKRPPTIPGPVATGPGRSHGRPTNPGAGPAGRTDR